MNKEMMTYLPVLVAGALIVWRQSRAQGTRLRPQAMWIAPIFVAAAVVLIMTGAPPPLTPTVLIGFPVALLAGAGLGVLLANHTHLTVDDKTGTVSGKASPVGLVLILGLLFAKTAFRSAGDGPVDPGHLGGAVLVWTDIGIVFSAGLVWGRVVAMTLRLRQILAAHRPGSAS